MTTPTGAGQRGLRRPPPPPELLPHHFLPPDQTHQADTAANAAAVRPCPLSQFSRGAAGKAAASALGAAAAPGHSAAATASAPPAVVGGPVTAWRKHFLCRASSTRSGGRDLMTRSAFGAFRCVYRVQFWAFAAGVFLGWLLLLLEQQQQQQEHTEGRSNPWLIRQAVARGFWILLFAGVLVHKQPNASSGSSGRSEQADLCYQCITLSVLGCCLVFFVLLLVRCRMPCAAAAESLFILLLLLHHGSEYLFVAAFHPVDLAYDSFLINNSPVYAAVLLLSLIEQQLKPSIAAAVLRSSNALLLLNLVLGQQIHLPQLLWQLHTFCCHALLRRPLLHGDADLLLEQPLQQLQRQEKQLPEAAAAASAAALALDPSSWVYWQLWIVFVLMLVAAMGFAAALLGLAVRGLGFLTLKENFTHQIRRRKNKGHTLCTRGIYSMCRHPAYAGWFWWAVGSQMLLLNCVCCCLFFAVSFLFFHERILFEERQLLRMFGREYEVYRQRVRTIGIPGLQAALGATEKAQRRPSTP
ncbi:uncharacterized protein LOC113147125 [Cyclospora cayetanensis]|uniref:Protein-S-isoprenylcysteine O-methyltransferase n=1 Tax=Cyclospora cayetanensis TaxID=88456 RepID=A0A6P6RYX5_9EIME|nr:uncharacterized protein LOC113147125 [Cyclospora cayetanensis]